MSAAPERFAAHQVARTMDGPEDVDGQELWVRASDYDALAAKLAEVGAERDATNDRLQHLIDEHNQKAWQAAVRFEAAEADLTAARAALVTARQEALEQVKAKVEHLGTSRPLVAPSPQSLLVRGRYEGEQAAYSFVLDIIRALATQTQEKTDE